VTISIDRLETLRPFARDPVVITECSKDFISLPGLKVRVNGEVRQYDALLCPSEIHGYKTRLFLSSRIEGKAQNWNAFVIAGKTWYAPSWQNVEDTLPLPQMLLAHLDAFV